MNNNAFTMETVPLKFGWGVIAELGWDLKALGISRVLVMTDPHLVALGLLDRALEAIREQGIEPTVYADVLCEPTDRSWLQAIGFARNLEFDGIVAIGGGSVIDTAKAVNLYTTYPEPILAYVNKPIGGGMPVPGPLKPLIAIPTTAGTGSETTSVAVLDLLDLELKAGISHRLLRPRLAVVDPELTMTMPPAVTAACGMDILCHALESYTSLPYDQRPMPENPSLRPPYVGANPVSDMWAGRAIEIGARYLPRAYRDGSDVEARSQLMLAATFAGMGFGNAGVHLPHAMSYPIAGMVKEFVPDGFPDGKVQVPHGMSVALGTPASFRFIGGRAGEKTRAAFGLLGGDPASISVDEAGAAVAECVADIMQQLEIPNGLAALGFSDEDVPGLAQGCHEQQRLLINTPVPVDIADLEATFRDAMVIW
ncbi:MAG: alcohol dehydrogenase [Gammaproteobacteria bacterium]|nr:MAG: alcohol dehydrogenase [Gammaproteobacteria bacterium]